MGHLDKATPEHERRCAFYVRRGGYRKEGKSMDAFRHVRRTGVMRHRDINEVVPISWVEKLRYYRGECE
ncbi:unnamed protein product [Hymenolepis diminuta]|uniref:Uncharacterized protein n=1 Tax=Hymenolepis diminuta TaxID=6216 RepID=A0A564Z4I7_HYMDI|nr:unnamed protein product [Hymenolepis diminuta]